MFSTKATACPDGFLGHAGSCYHFSHDTETWGDAVVGIYMPILFESKRSWLKIGKFQTKLRYRKLV